MTKQEKVFIKYLKDGNAYTEFLMNHGLTQKDISFREFMQELNYKRED